MLASVCQDNHHQLLIILAVVFVATDEVESPGAIESEDGVAIGEVRHWRICGAAVGVGLSGYLKH